VKTLNSKSVRAHETNETVNRRTRGCYFLL